MARKIQRETRLNIFDSIRIEKVAWHGQMNDVDFLSRLFDLESLPSEDRRFDSMSSDVWQHRINNDDWDINWVFDDKRLDLLNADDEVFLKFLCEMLHPVVRPDAVEAERLRQYFNDLLKADKFELIERARIAGRPVFAARALPPIPNLPISHARSTLIRADASYVSQQITRMESSVESDPGLAVGTAKELVETVCKTILEDRSVVVDKNWDLSQLVKSTTKELELTPDDIDNSAKAYDSIKRILANLATITQGLAELRNSYGTGHGRNARSKGLRPRHARLAVGAASTLAVFLWDTHQERLTKRSP